MRVWLCTCLLGAALLPACGDNSGSTESEGARDRSPAKSTPTPDRNLTTEFAIDLPDSWSRPSAAFVRRFRSLYRKQTGQEAVMRAIRADARGRIAMAMFVTVEPLAPGGTLEQLYAAFTEAIGGEFGEPERVQLDGTEAVAFDASVTEGGQPSESRVVLCPRGDRLVGLNFSTVEATKLAPARTEIDEMIESLRWRPA
jgi:hypothetical protein